MAAHPNSAQIAARLATLLSAAKSWEGTIYRFVTVPYSNRHDLLSGAGSRLHGGRWNPAGKFNVVYGSLTPATAIVESLGTYSAFGVPPEKARPRVFAAVRLRLQSVLDLRDPQTLAELGLTTAAIAHDDWQALQDQGRESLTQAIGRIAWEAKLEGILVPSARQPGGSNLAIFPSRRLPGSFWRIVGARDLPKKPSP